LRPTTEENKSGTVPIRREVLIYPPQADLVQPAAAGDGQKRAVPERPAVRRLESHGLAGRVIMRLTVRWRVLLAVLKDAWPIWLALGVAVLAFTAAWFLSTTPPAAIRYAGMMLQIFGLSTVAIGLSQMRRLFGRPSLSARIFAWFGRLVAAFTLRKPITGEGCLVGGGSTLTGEGRVVRGVRAGAPLEERVSVLEDNLERLRDELDSRVQRLKQGLATVKENIDRETQERQVEDQKTARKIEEVAVGGLHLETVGLFWLILGVVGTSVPEEIAGWLSLAG
jgi:hypothetical protein